MAFVACSCCTYALCESMYCVNECCVGFWRWALKHCLYSMRHFDSFSSVFAMIVSNDSRCANTFRLCTFRWKERSRSGRETYKEERKSSLKYYFVVDLRVQLQSWGNYGITFYFPKDSATLGWKIVIARTKLNKTKQKVIMPSALKDAIQTAAQFAFKFLYTEWQIHHRI